MNVYLYTLMYELMLKVGVGPMMVQSTQFNVHRLRLDQGYQNSFSPR